ncbi:hypothetical protein F5Y18DRAFT_412096 [Xylariaceae sp. FL1019]|nr:hypothetical protein F5Y18DRAFT_412096 [Xylariaceae sp. FL1019]
MLGWAFAKGVGGATGRDNAPEAEDDDTTRFDAPDTPAPIFAARAFKNAIFGENNPIFGQSNKSEHPAPAESKASKAEPKTEGVEPTTNATSTALASNMSPSKLNSILLTPGTGTSRRKRVSFGRDVKTGSNIDSGPLAATSTTNSRQRKKTALQQVMEDSRSTKVRRADARSKEQDLPAIMVTAATDTNGSEDEWEDDACCDHDMTVDLNEPYSESGKYWKAEYSRYRDDAKSDIEQLVTYKANAKSFAAKKDAEANELTRRLKEEQAKVSKLEEQVKRMATKVESRRTHEGEREMAILEKSLEKKTAQVSEYRQRIEELEDQVHEAQQEAKLLRTSQDRTNTSPRTEENLLEVSRELRKARSELRQMDRLRDEVSSLKSDLTKHQERVAMLEVEKKDVRDLEKSRSLELEKRLRETQQESRKMDADMRKLKRDYETLKNDAKARAREAILAVQDKDRQIHKLDAQVKRLQLAPYADSHVDALDGVIAMHHEITQEVNRDVKGRREPLKSITAAPRPDHRRSLSVDDLSLNMTQRSLLGTKEQGTAVASPRENPNRPLFAPDPTTDIISLMSPMGIKKHDPVETRRFLTNLTTDLLDFKPEPRTKTQEPVETKMPRKGFLADLTTDLLDFKIPRRNQETEVNQYDQGKGLEEQPENESPRRIRSRARRPLPASHPVTSDVLSPRVNESRPNQPRNAQEPVAKDHLLRVQREEETLEPFINRMAPINSGEHVMHGALERPSYRGARQAADQRAVSPAEAIFDLANDKFGRVGATPSTARDPVVKKSRCAIPADRAAAARARLEQKKADRKKSAARPLEKENLRL